MERKDPSLLQVYDCDYRQIYGFNSGILGLGQIPDVQKLSYLMAYERGPERVGYLQRLCYNFPCVCMEHERCLMISRNETNGNETK